MYFGRSPLWTSPVKIPSHQWTFRNWHDSFLGHLCSSTIISQREHQPYQHQMPASEHRILSQCPISLAVALSMNGKLVRFKELFQWCPTTKSFRQDSLTFSRNIICDLATLGPMSLQNATIHRWRSSSYPVDSPFTQLIPTSNLRSLGGGPNCQKCLHQPCNFPAHQIRQVSLYQTLFYLSSTSFSAWW